MFAEIKLMHHTTFKYCIVRLKFILISGPTRKPAALLREASGSWSHIFTCYTVKSKVCQIVEVCALLHNICKARNIILPEKEEHLAAAEDGGNEERPPGQSSKSPWRNPLQGWICCASLQVSNTTHNADYSSILQFFLLCHFVTYIYMSCFVVCALLCWWFHLPCLTLCQSPTIAKIEFFTDTTVLLFSLTIFQWVMMNVYLSNI